MKTFLQQHYDAIIFYSLFIPVVGYMIYDIVRAYRNRKDILRKAYQKAIDKRKKKIAYELLCVKTLQDKQEQLSRKT